MKQKSLNIALAITVLLFGISATRGQTATTTVNLVLADVISIDLEATASSIAFKYETAEDYTNTKSTTSLKSLIINSSTNFEVKVKADGENFNNGTYNIPVNVLQIKALPEGSMQGIFSTITLSTSNQKLIISAEKGLRKSVTLEYSISAEKAATVLLGKTPGSYTQTVTYTATEI